MRDFIHCNPSNGKWGNIFQENIEHDSPIRITIDNLVTCVHCVFQVFCFVPYTARKIYEYRFGGSKWYGPIFYVYIYRQTFSTFRLRFGQIIIMSCENYSVSPDVSYVVCSTMRFPISLTIYYRSLLVWKLPSDFWISCKICLHCSEACYEWFPFRVLAIVTCPKLKWLCR